MTTTMGDPTMDQPRIPYLERLRSELVAAHPVTRRARARRRRITTAGIAAMVMIAVFVAFSAFQSPPASATVIVTHDGDTIEVRLVTDRVQVEEVVTALREAGVRARVAAVPTGPSAVGRLVGIRTPTRSELGEPLGSGFGIVRFRAERSAETELQIGRTAAAGELYTRATNAYLPGEPLGCMTLRGMPTPQAVSAIAGLGLRVSWFDAANRPVAVPPPDAYVGDASASSATSVRIRLTATPTATPRPAGCGR